MNTDRFRFRVWVIEENKMFNLNDGFDLCSTYSESRLKPVLVIPPNVESDRYILGEECYLMQCTGLEDSEGKLIWEGDILTGVSHDTANFKTDDSKKVWITVVEWKYDMWYVGHGNYEYTNPAFGAQLRNCNNAVKVIGNIYENPELLDEES